MLVFVMVYIAFITSLLVSNGAQQVWLQQIIYRYPATQQWHYHTQKYLNQAQQQLIQQTGLSCSQPHRGVNYYFNKTLNWWRSGKACYFEAAHYENYFIVESIAKDACQRIIDSDKEIYVGVRYYRVSMLTLNAQLASYRVQSTVALPEKKAVGCQQPSRSIINSGQQSMRMLW